MFYLDLSLDTVTLASTLDIHIYQYMEINQMLINNPGSVEDVIHRVNRGMDGICKIIITFKTS